MSNNVSKNIKNVDICEKRWNKDPWQQILTKMNDIEHDRESIFQTYLPTQDKVVCFKTWTIARINELGHLRVRKNQDTLFSFIVARFMAGEKNNTEQKQEIGKKNPQNKAASKQLKKSC